jgi:general secretion pathway protein E
VDSSVADLEELKLFGIDSALSLYSGKGCEHCSFTGYYGRSGIFELLVIDDDIRKLILKNADSNQIRRAAKEHGMRTLLEDGAEKIKAGITTLSEVLRVTQEA